MANIFRPSTWLRGNTESKAPEARRTHRVGELSNSRETATRTQRLTISEAEVAGPSIQEEIEQRAYFLWCEAGCPEGRSEEYWLAAEREILERQQA